MWYLALGMIPFPPFDPEVTISGKKMIAISLSNKSAPTIFLRGKPIVSVDTILNARTLNELITEDALFLFETSRLFKCCQN